MKTLATQFSSTCASLLIMGIAFSGTASAAFISCTGTDYNISNKVSTATACTILGPLGGQANDATTSVNADGGFFGITDWVFDGKWEENGKNNPYVDTSALFSFTGGGQTGNFTYTGSSGISDIMFIFKDGNDTNLVGYRVPTTGGKYDTPFTNPPFNVNNAKDVSHISVYYRQGGTPPQQIPEPGVLFLMGAGLLGLSWARRTKSV